MNSALPELIARVRDFATVPVAVGFGVANRTHFDTVFNAGADAVVIGSRLVDVMKAAPADKVVEHVETFCRDISLKGQPPMAREALPARTPPAASAPPSTTSSNTNPLPLRFGQFGGQYVPEALVDCLAELEVAHAAAMADPAFDAEFRSHFGYMNRPSRMYLAENLTRNAGGANIWLKREDLYVVFIVTKH